MTNVQSPKLKFVCRCTNNPKPTPHMFTCHITYLLSVWNNSLFLNDCCFEMKSNSVSSCPLQGRSMLEVSWYKSISNSTFEVTTLTSTLSVNCFLSMPACSSTRRRKRTSKKTQLLGNSCTSLFLQDTMTKWWLTIELEDRLTLFESLVWLHVIQVSYENHRTCVACCEE